MAFLESALRREIVSREPEAFRRTYVPIGAVSNMGDSARDLVIWSYLSWSSNGN
jgi:hypothetical protein